MRKHFGALALTASIAAAPAVASDAPPAPVAQGDRVRVFLQARTSATSGVTTSKVITGEWLGSEAGQLRLRRKNGDVEAIDVSAVRRLEKHAGRRRATRRGAGIGFAVGSAAMTVFLIAALTCEHCDYGVGAGDVLGAVAITGAAGAVLGAAVGAPFKVDNWRAAVLPAPPEVLGLKAGRVHWALTSGPADGRNGLRPGIGARFTIGF
jgi:hypothetical protein